MSEKMNCFCFNMKNTRYICFLVDPDGLFDPDSDSSSPCSSFDSSISAKKLKKKEKKKKKNVKKKTKKKILEDDSSSDPSSSSNNDINPYHWKLTFKKAQVDLDGFWKITYVKPLNQWQQLMILHAELISSRMLLIYLFLSHKLLIGHKLYVLCTETIYGLFIRNTKELKYGPIILSRLHETLNARAVYSDLHSHHKLLAVGQDNRASTFNDLELQLIEKKDNGDDDPYSWNCTYKIVTFYSDSNKRHNMFSHIILKKNIPQKLRKAVSTKTTSTNKVFYNNKFGKAWRTSKLLCDSSTNVPVVDPITCSVSVFEMDHTSNILLIDDIWETDWNKNEWTHICYSSQKQVTDVKRKTQLWTFLRSLLDLVEERGVMTRFLVSSANVDGSGNVMDNLGVAVVEFRHSEPWQQHQQPSEQCRENVKHVANQHISFIGAFPSCWPITYEYAWVILHHCASSYPNFKIPLQVLTRQRVDLYPMLAFLFWKPVNYKVDDCSFLSESIKQGNCFVGMTKDTGHSFYGLNVL